MKRKYNTEIAKEIFNKHGYELINGEVNSRFDKVTIRDKNGYKFFLSLDKCLDRDYINPLIVSISNPYSIENIKNFMKINNASDTELLDKKYISSTYKMKWKCKRCSNIFERSWGKMSQSRTFCCKECSNNIIGEMQTKSECAILSIIESYGFKPIEKLNYKNTKTDIHLIHKNGYKANTNLNDLVASKGNVHLFHKTNIYTCDNIRNWIKLNNLDIELISNEYKSNNSLSLDVRCKCGEIYTTSWNELLTRHRFQCSKCSKSMSNIEYMTKIYLDKNNIQYNMQKTFDNLFGVRNGKLRFDFYLPKYNTCIEVDGEQHEKISKFNGETCEEAKEKFLIQKGNDEIKEKYCKETNLHLLRINWRDFRNDTYKTKIDKIIK